MRDLDTAGRAPAGFLSWARLDSDVSVATRDGDFAGYVDRRGPERYVVFDHHSRLVGTYPTLEAARLSLGASPSVHNTSGSWWARTRTLRSLATRYRFI